MGQRTGRVGANALRHELTISVTERSAAAPAVVYDLLADLPSHAVWGGERQSKTTRLLSIEAPVGAAVVGTEFDTTGADPMGTFSDRSVVTTADRPTMFEFVTEASLITKKGARADWTNVHRYELAPRDGGCDIRYLLRIVRISGLPGMLRIFNVPVLSRAAMKAGASVARRGVTNLARMAEERASSR